MIIWINGAFGVGKTQTAYELRRRLPGSFVYDPENVGFLLQKVIPPPIQADDFQDYPMWRAFNLDILDYCLQRYTGPIIVPMTVTNRRYYDELIGALSKRTEVRHVILCAKRETLLRRLASRFETPRSWAAQQIDRCFKAFDEDIPGCRINTDEMDIYQVVEKIASLSGVSLTEDKRSAFRRFFDRIAVKCRHIR